jgi:hypothetical protein
LAEAIERNIHTVGYDFTPYLPNEKADAVVLGCTHYIYIVEQIQRHFHCPVFDGNEGIARRLVSVLEGDISPNFGPFHSVQKDRDGRPLNGKNDPKMGLLTTKEPKKGICQKITNKRLQKMGKKYRKTIGGATVFFLGKQRDYNKNIREQMFVWLKRV